MPESVPVEVFAEIFYEEAIKNQSTYDEYEQMIKDEGISEDKERTKWEIFYLWIFILTYCLQRKFAHLGGEKIKKLLDAIHKHIYSPAKHSNLSREELKDVHNIITIRYSQYYKAIAADWEAMEKEFMEKENKGRMLFSTLVSAFLQNLMNRKLEDMELKFLQNLMNRKLEDMELKDYRKVIKFIMKFGLMLALICRDMFDWLEKIKSKYEIRFDD